MRFKWWFITSNCTIIDLFYKQSCQIVVMPHFNLLCTSLRTNNNINGVISNPKYARTFNKYTWSSERKSMSHVSNEKKNWSSRSFAAYFVHVHLNIGLCFDHTSLHIHKTIDWSVYNFAFFYDRFVLDILLCFCVCLKYFDHTVESLRSVRLYESRAIWYVVVTGYQAGG